jgi:hypothetical protein
MEAKGSLNRLHALSDVKNKSKKISKGGHPQF